jgi:hypothetical protein
MSLKEIDQDLSNLFADRLHKHVMDAIDLGDVADIPRENTIHMIMAYLMREVAAGAWSRNMKEEMFLKACQLAYRKTIKMLDAISKKQKAEQRH